MKRYKRQSNADLFHNLALIKGVVNTLLSLVNEELSPLYLTLPEAIA
jgi:hypothetical protein